MCDDPELAPYRTRLDVLFARDAPVAVILRRGPKKHFHLIRWNLRDDSFEHGQWMYGYVKLWDLSPNGDKLIYWAHQYHRPAPWRGVQQRSDRIAAGITGYDPLGSRNVKRSSKKHHRRRRKVPRYMRDGFEGGKKYISPVRQNNGVWTAISTPPYFSALAIWPSFGHWTGGGIFLSDTQIVLDEGNDGLTPQQNVPIPNRFWIMSAEQARLGGLELVPCSARDRYPESYEKFTSQLRAEGIKWVEWAWPQDNGDLLFACDGCVYRLVDGANVSPKNYLKSACLLVDLNDLSFRQLRAPADAMRW